MQRESLNEALDTQLATKGDVRYLDEAIKSSEASFNTRDLIEAIRIEREKSRPNQNTAK